MKRAAVAAFWMGMHRFEFLTLTQLTVRRFSKHIHMINIRFVTRDVLDMESSRHGKLFEQVERSTSFGKRSENQQEIIAAIVRHARESIVVHK